MIDAALARSPASDVDALVDAVDAVHAVVSRSQRELLRLIAEVDRQEAWRGSGARDTAHWLSMRYGVSSWKAHRWIGAAYALERLPRLAHALAGGDLAIDKVVELARFATPSDEAGLVRWTVAVSCATIRRRADRARDDDPGEARETERSRSLSWWWVDDGRRLGLEGELPAAQGAVVVRALERTAERVPEMPDERGGAFADARRADALVALCSSALAADATNDPDRATVVLHARVTPDGRGVEACEVDGGAPVPRSAVERLLCDARVEVVREDDRGDVVAIGRAVREPAAWMLRQLRYRDRGCRFPGCGTARFAQAHHVRWWSRGGRTEPDNLVLICSFHHRLVHEHGWSIVRHDDGDVVWLRPDGTRYRAGPSP